MKEKVKTQLVNFHSSIDEQTRQLTDLRNELMKDKTYDVAKDIFEIESYLHGLQAMTCNLLLNLEVEKHTLWTTK